MDTNEFKRRRQRLLELMGKGSMAILPTAPEKNRNSNTRYPYRSDSNFYYLTGFPEPEAIAVFIPEREQGQYILFCREKNAEKETWEGRRVGPDGAKALYGADDAFPLSELDKLVPPMIATCQRLFYPLGYVEDFDKLIMGWMNGLRRRVREGIVTPTTMVDLAYVIHELRLRKTEAELSNMRRATDISIRAHKRAMALCRPGLHEYQLAAEIEHEFAKSGCRSPAYPTIVASGANACILHHPDKYDVLQDGDLVLIDAGAELDYYASDITRTYPVNGRFNKQQKIIYELVLKAQKAAINKVYAGNRWIEPHQAAIQVITEGLKDLGILVGKVEDLIQEEAYKKFYMHRIGHWLGMDVHDGGVYKVEEEWRELKPGMVMTVEPGIYLPAIPEVPDEWRNIGVRIEDNVLITEGGHEVLTANLPKTVWEIEEFMANNQTQAQNVYGYDESGYDTGGMAEKPDLLVRSRNLVDDDIDSADVEKDATDFDFGN